MLTGASLIEPFIVPSTCRHTEHIVDWAFVDADEVKFLCLIGTGQVLRVQTRINTVASGV